MKSNMTCTECNENSEPVDLSDLSTEAVVRLCRTWKCAACLRTDEEVQAAFAAAPAIPIHERAHDWRASSPV